MKTHHFFLSLDQKQKGFTLVEVALVVALVGIISLFVAPDIVKFQPNIELNSASRELFSNMQNARLAALRENRNCAITFNPTIAGKTFDYVVYLDSDVDFKFSAGDRILKQVLLADSFDNVSFNPVSNFTPNSDGNRTIVFQPNGLPADPGGGIANGSAFLDAHGTDKKKGIVISRVGNISINDI